MDITVIETLAVAGVSIVPWTFTNLLALKHPPKNPEHSPAIRAASLAINSMATIFVLLYVALGQPSRLASLGIFPLSSSENIMHQIIAIVIGGMMMILLFMTPVSILSMLVHKFVKKDSKSEIAEPTKEFFSAYRTTKARLAMVLALLPSAIAEELVFRGYLILLLGQKTGAPLLCAVISAVLFAIMHLNNGRSLIPIYLWFAAGLTWITLSTGNLMVTIFAHWSWNVISALKVWEHMSRYPAFFTQEESNKSPVKSEYTDQ